MADTTKDSLPETPPAARARFLRDARALDAAEVLPLRADPAVAEANVVTGVTAVLAYETHVKEHLPEVDLDELRSLPDLAQAVVDAAREAGAEGDEARTLLGEAQAIRRKLRAAALALVEAGVLGARDLAKVGKDHGAVDVAADCVALGALFERRMEEVGGKTTVTAEEAARAAEVGASLRALLKPKGAARKAGADGLSPAEACDRLWTLLALRHERLWAVGAYIYGHAVDEHVPALLAPVAGRAGKPRAKAIAPADGRP